MFGLPMFSRIVFEKYGPLLVIFIGVFATISEFDKIDRTLDSFRLFSLFAGLGAGVAILLSRKLLRIALKDETLGARASYVLILISGFAALFVYFGSVLNRVHAPSNVTTKTFMVVSKGHSGRGNIPFIKVATPDGEEEFEVDASIWSSVIDKVNFVISPGNLGFDRVVQIEIPRS